MNVRYEDIYGLFLEAYSYLNNCSIDEAKLKADEPHLTPAEIITTIKCYLFYKKGR